MNGSDMTFITDLDFLRCFYQLVCRAGAGEPLDAQRDVECFFKVFHQWCCGVGRDVEVFSIGIEAKVHGIFHRRTDEAGDAMFVAFIEAFGHS